MVLFLLVVNTSAFAGVITKWNSPIMSSVASTYLAGNLSISKEDKKEVECLAKAIFFEARGESPHGKVLIANVILTRTKFGKPFASTICGVVNQKGQFDGVKERWKREAKFKDIAAKYTKNEQKSVENSLKIALYFVIFKPENTGYATHFSSNNYKFRDTNFIEQVGNHKFYQLKGNTNG